MKSTNLSSWLRKEQTNYHGTINKEKIKIKVMWFNLLALFSIKDKYPSNDLQKLTYILNKDY